MNINSKVLVKIAAGSGYDLAQKFTDEKGNPNKVLVPLDMGRTKPLAKHEVTARMLPEYKDKDTAKLLYKYPYSGFDLYSKEGVITPIPVDGKMNFTHFAQRPNSKMDVGLLDTNKAIAAQLGGGPLAEAVANASAEYVRQKRYSALSHHDKRRYNETAKRLGIKPHAITMTVPNNFTDAIVRTKPIPEDDEYGWWGRARILQDKESSTPLFYNTRNGEVSFPEGSSALVPGWGRTMFQWKNDPDDGDKIKERVIPNNNLFFRNYLNGKVPIVRENLQEDAEDPYGIFDINSPFSSAGLVFAKPNGYNAVTSMHSNGHPSGYEESFLIPGIGMSNGGLMFHPHELNDNDWISNGSVRDSKAYVQPADDKSIVDHESIHAFNPLFPNELLAHDLREVDDAVENLDSKSWYNLVGKAKATKKLNELFRKIESSDYSHGHHPSADNGFPYREDNYPSTGGVSELLRSIATSHRNYQKHLMNIIPEQMEARGELKDLTKKQQLNAMGKRIAELSHNGDNYLNFLAESGVGDGIPDNWKVLDNTMGGMSRREVNRAFTGLDEIMNSRGELIKRLSPEDLKSYFNKAPKSYREIQREYIRKVLPYLLRNDNKDVNPDGSVLA